MKIFERDHLEKRLSRLTKWHRISFAASCAQRGLPNYHAFSREENWGNYEEMLEAMNYVWEQLEEREAFCPEKLTEYIQRNEELMPDLDDFNTATATYALDACRAMGHTLKIALEDNSLDAAYAGQASFDTVDCFIQIIEKMPDDAHLRAEFKSKIAEHPLMVRELGHQRTDLELLEKTQPLTTAVVMQLRHISENGGRSNIGLQ